MSPDQITMNNILNMWILKRIFYFFVHNLSCYLSNTPGMLTNVSNHIWWFVTCFSGSRTWDLYLLLCPDWLGVGIAHWAGGPGCYNTAGWATWEEQDSKQHQFLSPCSYPGFPQWRIYMLEVEINSLVPKLTVFLILSTLPASWVQLCVSDTQAFYQRSHLQLP